MKALNKQIVESKPVVNLNGDSKRTLVNEWDEFAAALVHAVEKFPYASFHGRNQHVKGEDGHRSSQEVKNELLNLLSQAADAATEVHTLLEINS